MLVLILLGSTGEPGTYLIRSPLRTLLERPRPRPLLKCHTIAAACFSWYL